MIHYGDITKIKGSEVPKVDIITGGSPCQDLSVAGKREGLAGERSGLFMEQIRIVKEMREYDRRTTGRADEYIRPRFMVWENVPGAFSSNKGEDFRVVLEEICRIKDKSATIPGPPKGKWQPSGCIMGDGWSVAWRVHDAQFWGVPQRRKRISLVADFGGECAPEILFEREGVFGNLETCGEEGQDIATDVGSGVEETSRAISFQERAGKPGGGKGILIQDEHTGALSTLNNQPVCYGFEPGVAKRLNPESRFYEEQSSTLRANMGDNQTSVVCIQGNCIDRADTAGCNGKGWRENESYTLNTQDSRVKIRDDGMCQTLSSRMGTGGGNVPMVMETYQKTTGALMASGYDKLGTQEAMNDMYVVESQAWDGSQISPTLTANNAGGSQRMPDKDNFNAVIQSINGDVAGTLDASYYKGCGERQGTEREVVAEPLTFSKQMGLSDNGAAPALEATDYKEPQAVVYGLDRAAYNQGQNAKFAFSVDAEKVGPQTAGGPGAVCNNYIVRRLTPMEYERLQGYPDHWTDIGDWVDSKGKKHKGESDSPRYKALGNSIALPFWQWMAERMCKYIENPTMASLFDGIGGFPLVYSRCGCKPIWASEIEEFPIAVTKLRFMEEEA